MENLEQFREFAFKIKKEVDNIIGEMKETDKYHEFNCLSSLHCYDVSLNISFSNDGDDINYIIYIAKAQDYKLNKFILEELQKRIDSPYNVVCRSEW